MAFWWQNAQRALLQALTLTPRTTHSSSERSPSKLDLEQSMGSSHEAEKAVIVTPIRLPADPGAQHKKATQISKRAI